MDGLMVKKISYLVALTQTGQLPPLLALELFVKRQNMLLINQIDKRIPFIRRLLIFLQTKKNAKSKHTFSSMGRWRKS